MHIYHGTSFENYEKIIKNGFQTRNTNWCVSEPSTVYFYAAEKFCDSNGKSRLSRRELEQGIEDAKAEAAWNATISAALQGSKADYVIVLGFEVDNEELCPDWSCGQLMDTAVTMPCCRINEIIDSHAKISVHYFNYDPGLRYNFLASTRSNLLNKVSNLTDDQLTFVDAIGKDENCHICDAMTEFLYETYHKEIQK